MQLVPRGRGEQLSGGHDDGTEELQGQNSAKQPATLTSPFWTPLLNYCTGDGKLDYSGEKKDIYFLPSFLSFILFVPFISSIHLAFLPSYLPSCFYDYGGWGEVFFCCCFLFLFFWGEGPKQFRSNSQCLYFHQHQTAVNYDCDLCPFCFLLYSTQHFCTSCVHCSRQNLSLIHI